MVKGRNILLWMVTGLVAMTIFAAEASAHTLTIPWFNDAGGTLNFSTFLTVHNSSTQQATVTATYTAANGQDATPQANTFTINAGSSKSGRPFHVNGAGEGIEAGPPTSMPNTTSPYGSAKFSALLPDGALFGDSLRIGQLDQNEDGEFELFSGISPGVAQ